MMVVQAREFQELAKTEALNAARTMIEAKRWQSFSLMPPFFLTLFL
jgi:hypothetical protein